MGPLHWISIDKLTHTWTRGPCLDRPFASHGCFGYPSLFWWRLLYNQSNLTSATPRASMLHYSRPNGTHTHSLFIGHWSSHLPLLLGNCPVLVRTLASVLKVLELLIEEELFLPSCYAFPSKCCLNRRLELRLSKRGKEKPVSESMLRKEWVLGLSWYYSLPVKWGALDAPVGGTVIGLYTALSPRLDAATLMN